MPRTTEEIRAEQAGRPARGSIEEKIEQLMTELHIVGFAVVKEIARLKGHA